MQPAIIVEDLKIEYSRKRRQPVVRAVNHISFQVEPGHVVGFLGPNGAGKSSTLKAIMGFNPVASGSVHLFGLDSRLPASRVGVGYLPEVAMYYPFLTPLETLRMYGEVQGISAKQLKFECMELLELVGLAEAANRQNRTMSKGMLQRVGIAQSLLGEPRLLVLDEMTSGLDPIGRRHLRDLLHTKQKQGCTIFFSSHELAEVEMLCDRIILLNKGEILEQRDLTDLQKTLHEYMLVFKGTSNLTDLTLDVKSLERQTSVARFDSKELLLRALARVQIERGEILDVHSREGSLEDYFIDKIEVAA